jgi:hypothetical protein
VAFPLRILLMFLKDSFIFFKFDSFQKLMHILLVLFIGMLALKSS